MAYNVREIPPSTEELKLSIGTDNLSNRVELYKTSAFQTTDPYIFTKLPAINICVDNTFTYTVYM